MRYKILRFTQDDIHMEIGGKPHKEHIRQQAKNTLATLSLVEKKEQNETICEKLTQYIDQYQNRSVFIPFSYEPDIQPFIQKLWEQNKVVLLPQIHEHTMQLALYTPDSLILQGQHGEAIIQDPIWYQGSPDVCLVPGLAFDTQGRRVGHGKGYYDRFLAANDCYRIGVGFLQTKIPTIKYDNWDQRMDEVIL